MGKKEDLTIIKKFASKVRKEMPVEEIILFGSRAKGDNKKDSDFDFVIVSKKFAGLNFFERSKNINNDEKVFRLSDDQVLQCLDAL